ncbi:MAG TPA: hypothetical protein VGD57_11530 [Candidatus Dormibacteraeota bacterium]
MGSITAYVAAARTGRKNVDSQSISLERSRDIMGAVLSMVSEARSGALQIELTGRLASLTEPHFSPRTEA